MNGAFLRSEEGASMGWMRVRPLARSGVMRATFKAVSCALWAPELLLLCLSKGEVTKRKRHPDSAPSRHPAFRVRGRLTGFSDGTSLYRRKTGPHPCGPSCGLSSTHPPRQRGPGKATRSCAQKQKREHTVFFESLCIFHASQR